ncbi:hypothetical protein J4216_05360 [Candidatus Woesearchaeota archaeon]|nr:hypothetical protein [Candidatus Woesearchaeota archaeon]
MKKLILVLILFLFIINNVNAISLNCKIINDKPVCGSDLDGFEPLEEDEVELDLKLVDEYIVTNLDELKDNEGFEPETLTIKKPKLDINLKLTELEQIPKNIDVELFPVSLYSLWALFGASILLVIFILIDSLDVKGYIKGRRGQVFIMAALIFALLLFPLVIKYNTVTTYPNLEEYKETSEIYQKEFPKVINYGTYRSLDSNRQLDNFSLVFLGEARKKDPEFGGFYMFKDVSGNLHIVNTLNEKVLTFSLTNLNADQVNLTLLSNNYPTNGTICITDVSCTSVSSFVGDFGSAFYQSDVLAPDSLDVQIIGDPTAFPLDISNFTSAFYLTSSTPTPLPGAPNQVRVTLAQY